MHEDVCNLHRHEIQLTNLIATCSLLYKFFPTQEKARVKKSYKQSHNNNSVNIACIQYIITDNVYQLHTHTLTHSHSHTCTLTHSHSHTCTLTHSHSQSFMHEKTRQRYHNRLLHTCKPYSCVHTQ